MTVRFPSSSTYWNLRAEQVMNNVFETAALEPVEVAVHEHDIPGPALARPAAEQPTPSKPADHQPAKSATGLISLLTFVAVSGTVSSGWLLSHWQSSRDQLAQERSLLMLERLRDTSTHQQATHQTETPRTAVAQPEGSAALSPPPPEPAWMSELEPLTLEESQLPAMATTPPATPITSIPITSTAITATPSGPMPQLTGVVQGPGGNSSAIFQFGASSFSAGLGEAIGSSGWVLDSVGEAGAVIRRNGQRHNLAVGGVL